MKKLILLTALLLSGFGLQGRGCKLGGICWDEEFAKASVDQCVAQGGEVNVSCKAIELTAEVAAATAALEAAKAALAAEVAAATAKS